MTTPEKILVIQLRQIGDVLLTTPAAEVLRRNFPGARIDFLTEPPADQVLAGNRDIDNIIIYDRNRPVKAVLDVRRTGYDLVLDFMSNPRSALLTFASGAAVKAGPAYTNSAWAYNRKLAPPSDDRQYNAFQKIDLLRQLGVKDVFYPYPKLRLDRRDIEWGEERFAALGFAQDSFVVGFSPASRRTARQWPKEHFIKLAGLIVARYPAYVLVTWGPGEKELADEIVKAAGSPRVRLAPATPTVRKLASLFRKLKLVVANFNGGKHIAQAAGVPTLGICSYDLPGNWTPPDDPDHQAVKLMAENCAGCLRNDCVLNIKCLRELSPETVFAKLVRMPPMIPLAGAKP